MHSEFSHAATTARTCTARKVFLTFLRLSIRAGECSGTFCRCIMLVLKRHSANSSFSCPWSSWKGRKTCPTQRPRLTSLSAAWPLGITNKPGKMANLYRLGCVTPPGRQKRVCTTCTYRYTAIDSTVSRLLKKLDINYALLRMIATSMKRKKLISNSEDDIFLHSLDAVRLFWV